MKKKHVVIAGAIAAFASTVALHGYAANMTPNNPVVVAKAASGCCGGCNGTSCAGTSCAGTSCGGTSCAACCGGCGGCGGD